MFATSDTLLERPRVPADGEARNELVELYSPLIRGWLRRDALDLRLAAPRRPA
jgi:hypothetical protein